VDLGKTAVVATWYLKLSTLSWFRSPSTTDLWRGVLQVSSKLKWLHISCHQEHGTWSITARACCQEGHACNGTLLALRLSPQPYKVDIRGSGEVWVLNLKFGEATEVFHHQTVTGSVHMLRHDSALCKTLHVCFSRSWQLLTSVLTQ